MLAPLQTALALFAVVVIVRSLTRKAYSWLSRSPDSDTESDRSRLRFHRPSATQLHPQPQPYAQPFWAMDDEKPQPHSAGARSGIKGHHHVSFDEPQQHDLSTGRTTPLAIDPNWKSVVAADAAAVPKPFLSRPPPAPPLTPPELSTAVFTFDDRPRSQESFINQPNPDYTSATPSSSSATTSTSTSQSSSASPATPRRRSYNKTLPIGIPISMAHKQPDAADLTLSPSSYPPTSPLLPPAPPELRHYNGAERTIGVQGEVISVLDGEGAGWTRHTRVYGGGVCLACAASGGDHGGFYGATVRPEEMR